MFVLYFYFIYAVTAFTQNKLTLQQARDIQIVLKNNATPQMKKTIQKILYTHYEKYAYCKAIKFKSFHKYKTRHISNTELFIYSARGLQKACQRYNGCVPFIYYAEKYIVGELYTGMTKLHPISNLVYIENIEHSDNPDFSVINLEYQNIVESSICNSNISATTKKILYYKYDTNYNKIRTNKQVAELMCCSQESIRKHLNKMRIENRAYQNIL